MPPRVPMAKQKRAKPHQHHYGNQHQQMAKLVIAKTPLCELRYDVCTNCATEANHLVYPAVRLEDYQAVCRECHMEYHYRQRRSKS